MGKRNGPYHADFPAGTSVRIASRGDLETFAKTWRLHNPLVREQLAFAGRTATVKSVGYYHGADEVYELVGIPGVWHKACLESDV